jgi:hypothetical protein
VAWGLVLGVPLCTWLAFAVLLLAQQPRRIPPSGDRLLDTWLQAAMDTNTFTVIYGGYSGELLSGGITERTWKKWEGEFGCDPRFWMLCYRQRRPAEPEYYSTYAGVKVPGSCRYLEEARRRGLADATVLYNLLRDYDSAWNASADDEIKAQGGPAPVRTPLSNAQRLVLQQRRYRDRSEIVDSRFSTRETELLKELLAAAPDEAFVHYFAGQLACERQDYAAALAHIECGNQAPHNDLMIGFPNDIAVRTARAGHLVGGDVQLTGVLHSGTWWWSAERTIDVKQMVDGLSAWATEQGDWQTLNALQQYACRYATTETGGLMEALVGSLLLQRIKTNVKAAMNPTLTQAQWQALGKQASRLGALQGKYHSLTSQYVPMYRRSPLEQVLAGCKDFATRGRAGVLDESAEECKSLQREQAALAGPLRDAFAEIARFDYTTFTWRAEPPAK